MPPSILTLTIDKRRPLVLGDGTLDEVSIISAAVRLRFVGPHVCGVCTVEWR